MKQWQKGIFSLIQLGLMLFAAGCMTTHSLWDVKKHEPVSGPKLVQSSPATNIFVCYDERVSGMGWEFLPKKPAIEPRAYWLFSSTNVPPAFIEGAYSDSMDYVPVADLNCFDGTNTEEFNSDAKSALMRTIECRADLTWLKRDVRGHAAFIVAGVNASGEPLYVTNSLPTHAYYWKLSSTPLRYLFVTNTPPDEGFYAVSFGNRFTVWQDGKEIGTFSLPTYRTQAETTNWRIALTPVAVITDGATDCAIGCMVILILVSGAGNLGGIH